MFLKRITIALMLSAAGGFTALAQESGHDMHQKPTEAEAAPSSRAFVEANAKMHKGMVIVFSGNADVDFVRGMIAHHQGAIDMAKIVLDHGKDQAIRKLAEDIITAQEAEIKMMKAWLTKNGS